MTDEEEGERLGEGQGGCAVDAALFQVYEGFIGGFEWVGVDVGADGDLGGEGERSSRTSCRVLLAALRMTSSS